MLRPTLLLAVVVLMLVLPAEAFAARCGNGHGGPDYYDLRAEGEACSTARSVARTWARRNRNVFDRVSVRGHSCRGSRSARAIRGVRTFKIVCRDGGRLAYWWVRPFH